MINKDKVISNTIIDITEYESDNIVIETNRNKIKISKNLKIEIEEKYNSDKFLEDKINLLLLEFPKIKCSLEYSLFDGSHCIKIEPEEYFESAKTFLFKKLHLAKEISKLYPYEGVHIITTHEFIDIDKPTLIKKGVEYISEE